MNSDIDCLPNKARIEDGSCSTWGNSPLDEVMILQALNKTSVFHQDLGRVLVTCDLFFEKSVAL